MKFSFFRSYMLFGIFKFELGDPFFDGQCSKQQQDASNGMNYSTLVLNLTQPLVSLDVSFAG